MILVNFADVKVYNTAGVMLQHTCPFDQTELDKELLKWAKRMEKPGHNIASIKVYRWGKLRETISPVDK